MQTTEYNNKMTSNENDQQQQSHFLNSDELPTSSNKVLKKRSLLLNLIKPSLSLTSLPPQSPKEHANESTSTTERPYNSLKVGISFKMLKTY